MGRATTGTTRDGANETETANATTRARARAMIGDGGFDAMTMIRRHKGGTATREETIAVPSMGDSISEGAVASVMKAVGDEVATDETVAQIETDKVTTVSYTHLTLPTKA